MSVAASAPPAQVVEPTDVLWRRAGAFVVDEAIALVVGMTINALLPDAVARNARILAFVVAWTAVFVVAQGLTGATPGKLLAGIRVVDEHGRPPGLGPALVRSLAWIVDGFPYVVPFVGFVAAADDGDGRRLGDRWAATYVVAVDLAGHPPFPVVHAADGSPPRLVRTNPVDVPPPSALTPPTMPALEPTYDRVRGTYVRWDLDRAALVEFDEDARTWQPLPPAGAAPPGAPAMLDRGRSRPR